MRVEPSGKPDAWKLARPVWGWGRGETPRPTPHSDREYEATLENITDAAWRVGRDYDLPDGWESEVYSWLSDHEQGEIENTDDQGGYPSEAALRRAADGLGYGRIEKE